ncbi:MAG: STAS domain-containing protein [Actinobacteria bacterium]|nr:STAS domain-containing protein [Actinomycetota bacterium]
MNFHIAVSTTASSAWALISVSGPITVNTAHQLRERLQMLAGSAARIVLDLSEVDSFDVAGVAVVTASARSADRVGGWLRVVVPADDVGLVLSAANTREPLDLYDSLESATAGLD